MEQFINDMKDLIQQYEGGLITQSEAYNKLIDRAIQQDYLQSEVEVAERKAGWDPNP